MEKDNRFRIKSVNIKRYYSREYPGLGVPKLDGKSLFVSGTNNTGKTTSFDAIISSIFGYKFIDRSGNTLDDTKITLENKDQSLTIHRRYGKTHHLIIQEPGQEKEVIEGQTELEGRLIELLKLPDIKLAKLMIQALVLPQEPEDTVLRKLSQNDLKSVILAFSSGVEISQEIKGIEQRIKENKQKIETLRYQKNNTVNLISELKIVIRKNEKYFREIGDFLSLYDSGRIFEIKEALEQNNELKTELESLTSALTGQHDSLFGILKKIGKLNQYHNKKLIESVKETLSVLMCPVCEDNLNVEKVEGRKNKRLCPFCGKEEYPGHLYGIIEGRINEADSKIEDLRKQERETSQQIKNLTKRIGELKQDNKTISETNPVIVRVIKNCKEKQGIQNRYGEYKEEYLKLKRELEETEEEINSNMGYAKQLSSEIEGCENKTREMEEKMRDIEEKRNKENIEKFSKTMNSIYMELIKPLKHTLVYEDGKLYLDTDISKKDCSNKTDLGHSQKRIIDVALWLTFHELNYKRMITHLNFGLFDDIFENIDNNDIKWKTNLINALKSFKEKQQLITFSIDKSLNADISCEEMKVLDYQTKLDKFKSE